MIVTPPIEAEVLLREQLPGIIAGTFFIWAGFLAFAIAAIRRRGGVNLLLWLVDDDVWGAGAA
jgi:hypothetical protein